MKALNTISTLMLITLISISNGSWAQAAKELDITLSIVDEQDSPETIINRIPLPPPSTVIPSEDSVVASSTSNTLVAPVDEAIETIHNQVENTTNQVLDTTRDVLTNKLNDTISVGNLDALPSDIIDKLPQDLPDDILTPADDLIDDLGKAANNNLANPQESLDSAIDELEAPSEIPSLEQDLPPVIPELPDSGGLPQPLPEPSPVPLDDLTQPLNH